MTTNLNQVLADDLLAEIRKLIDTTKLSADDFCELCQGAIFYAKAHTAKQAAELAVEEVLSEDDRKQCAVR